MSTKNKTSLAAQALLEMETIKATLKEESKKTLNTLLEDAVRNVFREECCKEDEQNPEDEYEVINSEDNKDNEDSSNENSSEYNNDETQEALEKDGESENEMDDYSEYKVDKDTYDLTGENDYDKVVKVYKLLKGDDNVIVKKDNDKIQLKDETAGTEYVIDLGSDEDSNENSEENNFSQENLNEEDIAGLPNDFDFEGHNQYGDDSTESYHINDEYFNDDKFIEDFNNVNDDVYDDSSDNLTMENKKFKKSRKPMKESKEVLFEVDLGYTDSYQDKDPIAGLSNNEPSKSGKSWDKGIPTGTTKPWAGNSKSKGNPFGKTISEEDENLNTEEVPVDEQTNVGGFVQQNSVTSSYMPNSDGRKARSQRGSKVTGSADPRYNVSESKEYKSLLKELNSIKKENKELKEAVVALRKNYNEAYMTNVNLGKITKLFLENSTSQKEKYDIVNRFSDEAKTLEQSKALYESISRELKKTTKTININESSMTAKGTKELNETKVYKSNDLLKTLDLMNRMSNC